jgi:hypothetical protein
MPGVLSNGPEPSPYDVLSPVAGHSPDNEPDEPARPKAARPGRPPNGGGASARPLGVPLAPGAAAESAPWITEKKRQLQV